MNLVLDIGNTLVKAAIFNQNNLVELIQQEQFSEAEIDNLVVKYKIKWHLFFCKAR